MAKTLVIKGADYSTNKIEKVTFAGVIPCTGIELSESAYSLSDYDPVDIDYTVTPSNTTDEVVLESSDTDVVVIENGKAKAVGLGTATITATCGSHSDTATVTVSITYDELYTGGARTTKNNDHLETSPWQRYFTTTGNGTQQTTFESIGTADPPVNLKAIKLPLNTAKVKVSRDSTKGSSFNYEGYVNFTKDEFCGNAIFPTGIKTISQEEILLATTAEYVFNVPSGADSVIVTAGLSNVPENWNTAVANTGFKLEFLAE